VRVVLDTNVAVSALIWRRTPHRLLSAIRERSEAVQLFSSESLMMELADVLGRTHLTKQLAVIGRTPAQVFAD
jgi:Predicted nucleic acid-binding protein, contains PIN domain